MARQVDGFARGRDAGLDGVVENALYGDEDAERCHLAGGEAGEGLRLVVAWECGGDLMVGARASPRLSV